MELISLLLQIMQNAQQIGMFEEIMDGNFVVTQIDNNFNQVSTDQTLEHINGECKVVGDLIGNVALSRNWNS